MSQDTVIIIPARLGSTRLPRKILAPIKGIPMIVRVMKLAQNIINTKVIVAVCSEETAKIVKDNGGEAIITSPNISTGTDRIYEALCQLPNNERYKYVINLQGDMPFFNSNIINELLFLLKEKHAKMATLAAKTDYNDAIKDQNVKVAIGGLNNNIGKALYFSRNLIPHNASQYYKHIGIYGFTTATLKQFVNLPQTPLEQCEKLEQLRALENDIDIMIKIVDSAPISIDTPEDLELAKNL